MEGIKNTSDETQGTHGIRKNSADEAFKGEKFNSNLGREIFVFTKERTLLGYKRRTSSKDGNE